MIRAMKWRLVVLLPMLVLSACIGRREALELTGAMRESTDKVRVAVADLKAASVAENEQLAQTRKLAVGLYGEWGSSRLRAAKAELELDYVRALAGLERDRTQAREDVRADRRGADALLDTNLAAQMAPLEREEAFYETAALEARKRAQQFPGDVELRARVHELDRTYLAIAAINRDIELTARERVRSELDKQMLETLATIDAKAAESRQEMQDAYTMALGELPGDAAALDLGPEAPSNAGAFDRILEYIAEVRNASEAYSNYLVSNSGGSGSFADGLLKSVGKGLLAGAFKTGGAAPSISQVKDSFRPVAEEVLGAARTEMKDLGAAASKSLGDLVRGFIQGQMSQVSSLAENAVNEASTKSRTGTTGSTPGSP